MITARVGFGCTVDNYGERIFVIGGSIGKHKATDKCEFYNIDTDEWKELPNLPEARFSSSLCIFNDEWLFNFGGFDKSHNVSD